MSLLVARHITHAYRRSLGRRAPSLQGVDLVLAPGQCWAVIGPNGSGKSTLLRVLAGLTTPLTGDVALLDRPVSQRDARRRLGYAPESVRWPAAMSVNDVLTELAALSSRRDIVARVDRAVAVVGIEPLLGRRLGSLSHGQARRVALAQALLDDPAVLLLDEPFAGLDSLVVRRLREDLLLRLAAGSALALASHRLEDLVGLCTHVLVLREGRPIRSGPAEHVLDGIHSEAGLADLLEAPA